MLNLFDYDFGVRLIKPDPNIYYRTIKNTISRCSFGAPAFFCAEGAYLLPGRSFRFPHHT